MRTLYSLIFLGLLTACTRVPQIPEVKPSPKNLKTLNSLYYQITDSSNTGIEKINRQESSQRSPILPIVSPSQNPLNLKGELRVSGSHISLPISRVIADKFIEHGFPGQIHLSASSTNKGLK